MRISAPGNLDALPQRERIYRQLLAQKSATSSSYHEVYSAGGQVFAVYDEPRSSSR